MKIFGILAIIFCGVGLAVPWAGYDFSAYGISFSLNAWGASSDVPSGDLTMGASTTDLFYIETITSGQSQGVILGICMILVFIFTLITLLIGVKAFKNIKNSADKTFLTCGILAIVTIILCVIGVGQLTGYIGSQTFMPIGYSYGFILMIIAMIFFFINFGLKKYFMASGAPTAGQKPMSQQPQQPAQYTPPPPPPPAPPQTEQQPKQPEQTKKFCSNCGAQINPNSKFCPSCGNKV